MKYSFAIAVLFVVVFSTSCETKEERLQRLKLEQSEKDQIQASLLAEQENTKIKEDSLKRYHAGKPEFIKEQSKIAFAEMKFGMSEEEVDKVRESVQSIGGRTFFNSTRFNDDDELYFVQLYTISKTANYIDTDLKEQWGVLLSMITDRYGSAEITSNFPTIFDFSPGRIRFTHIWEIGSKVIRLGLSEDSRGSTYKVTCWIYDEPVYEAISIKQEEEEKQSLKEGSDLF